MLPRGIANRICVASACVLELLHQLLQQSMQRMGLGFMLEARLQPVLRLVPKFTREVPEQDDRLVAREPDGDAFLETVIRAHGRPCAPTRYFPRTPANAMTSRHFFKSPRMRLRSPSGELASASIPCCDRVARTSGSSRMAMIARLRRDTIASAVARGITSACHTVHSYPARPNSARVGT